jgi:hypothetical protein
VDDRRVLADALKRFEQQSAEVYETAQQWLREARTQKEKERANSLMRHARGVIVHAGAGRQELDS